MKIGAISFRAYEPYPVNGGKVEQLQYEIEHGMSEPSDNQVACHDIALKKSNREFQEWEQNSYWVLSGLD